MTAVPRVSVVIPAYQSHATIERCLASIASQTWRDHEVIVVDSSPDDSAANAIREHFPAVLLVRSRVRLLPHAARNVGVEHARGELVVFTDPDIYLRSDWLDVLVRSYDRNRCAIVGAFACHGNRWLHQAFHFTKFSKWLPGGPPRPVDMGPSGNLLVSRAIFGRAGGFPGELWSGDVELSRKLAELGRLWFEPQAVGEHHHTQSLGEFLRERLERGRSFGMLRSCWLQNQPGRVLGLLAVSILPVRLFRNLVLVGRHAAGGGCFLSYLTSLPIIAAGYFVALCGESLSYAHSLVWRRRAARQAAA
ncbi:MAG: glycosyltransferase family 2 protein [Thermoanaerobaculia bacterium]